MRHNRLLKITSLFLLSTILFAQYAIRGTSVTVTTSGTPVRLSNTRRLVKGFTVQAKSGNSGAIYLGGSDVLASSENGISLAAGASIAYLPISDRRDTLDYNLYDVWIDATVSGDGVLLAYVQ